MNFSWEFGGRSFDVPAEQLTIDTRDDMPLEDVVITSQAGLNVGAPAPKGAFRLADQPGFAVVVTRAEGKKCARSWKVLPSVGSDPRYPDLSPRDAEAVAAWDAAHSRSA